MKSSGLKIATIGGGSSYTPELIEGFIKRYDELPISEIWLVDIEAGKEKLEIVGNLAKRMVEKSGLPIQVHLTLDRRKAIDNADFVTTQFRVGLLDARILDERIPLSHGVLGQETNGPGGLFKAFRTIPVLLDIIKDIEELSPNAWLINFANPAGMITEAVFRYTNFNKFIGLCNVPVGMQFEVAKLADVEPERLQIDFAGLNHLVYALDIKLDGVSIKHDLYEKVQNLTAKNVEDFDWNLDFLRALDAVPCYYHRYYYKSKEMLESALGSYANDEVRGQVVKKVEEDLFKIYKNPDLNEKPKQLEERGGAHYSDAACNLIASIYSNKCDIQTVNTLNKGAISSLPDDVAVEVSCMITSDGPKPLAMGQLPIGAKGLVQQMKDFELVAVRAAVTGNYKDALLAMTVNPLVPSDDLAKVILDEMLLAHKAYLPQFEQ